MSVVNKSDRSRKLRKLKSSTVVLVSEGDLASAKSKRKREIGARRKRKILLASLALEVVEEAVLKF